MQVRDVMTQDCEFIAPDTTVYEAAQKMRDLDCGFLPIGNESEGKLKGVITDRDIVIRAIAEGKDPQKIRADEVKTDKVLYCFEDDGLVTAARSMEEQQVHRLIVLNDRSEKKLSGVVTLGDIARHKERNLAGEAISGIAASEKQAA